MDMSGNVWEWYLNEYANPDDSNVAGEATRALRGGSWFNPAVMGYKISYPWPS